MFFFQTSHVARDSNNSSKNPKEGTVFILVLRKCRIRDKECNPVTANMYDVMYAKKLGHEKIYVRKEKGIQRNTRSKTQ